ncbi:DUF3618 domain-containing protein [Actinosynnema sp. NPDC023587]|uniref:DUF3618 domain-containing protein n=1 Tax=Actinosynnema sp. NPDC023587 TaxID=3154695 RepID=UPI0033D9E3C6
MSEKDIPKDPAKLRRDIEETRRELGDTVEALAHKADVPARVKESVNDGVGKAKVKAGEAATRVDQAVTRAAAEAQVAADVVVDKASTAAGQVAEKASVAAGQVADKATAAAGQVADKASVAAGHVAERAAHVVESLPQPVQDKVVLVSEQARRRPVAVLGGLAAAVLLVTWLVRRGR